MRSFAISFAAVLVLTMVALASGSASAGRQPFAVRSTIDGRTVLPLRVQWIASPTLAETQVAQVEFLIDGKVRWIEHDPPYTYGEDGGFLVTTWLAPARHRFAVRVTASDGRKLSKTLLARVRRAPAPPRALVATWARVVTRADQRRAHFGDPPPAGRWLLVFDRVGMWELDPRGSGLVNHIRFAGSILHVLAPIQLGPDRVGVSRFGRSRIGGYECTPAGPAGSYTWRVVRATLRLKPRNEPCGGRRVLLEGVWRRVR